MNTYEFWNDMDKIYDAIVAYQEKNIEFNKQFINPWIKLGNVFDKNESNEEIIAHKNAIEIDPKNAQNWYDLANVYTRFGDFEKSIQSYQKAIELGFESGELYKNLALAYTMTAKHQDSIPFFQKALEMLETNKEKAFVLNHLGNVFRKLNNYELAFQAYQQADQFEAEKSPIMDELPAVPVQRKYTEKMIEKVATEEVNTSLSKGEITSVASSNPTHKDAAFIERDDTLINNSVQDEPVAEQEEEFDNAPAMPSVNEVELPDTENDQASREIDESDNEMQVVFEVDFSSGAINEEIEAASFEEDVEDNPFLKFLAGSSDDEAPVSLVSVQDETEDTVPEYEPIAEVTFASEEGFDGSDLSEDVEALHESDAKTALSAYEEYLVDNDPVGVNLAENASNEIQTISMATADVATTSSEVDTEVSTDLTVEMNSKNAHAWNELGNVYFNAGSYDDAIAAYRKAIELDTQFAWPYTNLALSYVQKGQLSNAISLYQRGIELLSNEKDKAVAWNRLGNVYRRMNDYENAITAYQHADDLDPGNTAVTQQSRFSLLGSEKVEQEAEYSV